MQQHSSTKQEQNLNKVIKIDESQIQNNLDQMVKASVEETINHLLNTEADHLCNEGAREENQQQQENRLGRRGRLNWSGRSRRGVAGRIVGMPPHNSLSPISSPIRAANGALSDS